jgi:hypothetical protein
MTGRLLAISLLVPLLGAILATGVRSQDKRPKDSKAMLRLRVELATTLKQAFEGSLAEYRGGRASPEMLLRLSADLYDAEVAIADPGEQVRIAGSYRDRAQQIELSAKSNYDQGTGDEAGIACGDRSPAACGNRTGRPASDQMNLD